MTHESEYLLNVGEADEERMRRMNEVYNPETQRFLLAAGLKPGMRVLDVACGTGIMTRWLAEQVGQEGSVHAIDECDSQLEITEKNTKNLHNITLECRSVYTLDCLANKFDFIYSRFLLVHLQTPEKALKKMAACLNSTGVLAIVSAIHSGFFSEPNCNAYYKFINWYFKMLSNNASDPHWGKQLLPAMKRLDLQIKVAKSFMPILHSCYEKEFLQVSLKAVEEILIQDGLSREELGLMYKEFSEFSANENSYYCIANCMMVAGTAHLTKGN